MMLKGQKISHDTNDDDDEKNELEGFDSNKLRLTLSIQDTRLRLYSIFSQSIRIELIMTMTMTFTMMSMTMMMATMVASGVVVPVKPGSSLII